jgi:DNA-binding transcriptional LysR family regulator
MFELSDLRIFVTVVGQGGIVNAARRLNRVPSNITTRIRQLEAELGTPLFYRQRQRLHLSPEGKLFLPYAEKLLRLSDEAGSVVSATAPGGMLRLGALESTTASRLPAILAAFHKAYPEVRIELSTGTNDALAAQVLARELDAAFIAEAPASNDIAHVAAFDERLTIISALGHRAIRSPQDAAGDSVVAFSSGCAYRRRLFRWLGETSTATTAALNMSSYHAIVACVGAGAGIALMPESVLDTLPKAQVMRHRLPPRHSSIATPLIWRAGEDSRALVALRALL